MSLSETFEILDIKGLPITESEETVETSQFLTALLPYGFMSQNPCTFPRFEGVTYFSFVCIRRGQMNECAYMIYGASEAYETFQKLPRAKLTAQFAPFHQPMSPRALRPLCSAW